MSGTAIGLRIGLLMEKSCCCIARCNNVTIVDLRFHMLVVVRPLALTIGVAEDVEDHG